MSSANPQSATEAATWSFSLPTDFEKAFKQAKKKWDSTGNTERLWRKDASLWTNTDEAKWAGGDRAGHHSLAITDPDSKLEGISEKLGFRRLYHGVPSIGGRYSALSDFGLVPHAAVGLDTERLLGRAAAMVERCRSSD